MKLSNPPSGLTHTRNQSARALPSSSNGSRMVQARACTTGISSRAALATNSVLVSTTSGVHRGPSPMAPASSQLFVPSLTFIPRRWTDLDLVTTSSRTPCRLGIVLLAVLRCVPGERDVNRINLQTNESRSFTNLDPPNTATSTMTKDSSQSHIRMKVLPSPNL